MQITIENSDTTLTVPDNTEKLELLESVFEGDRFLELEAKLSDGTYVVISDDQYLCSLLEQAGFTSIEF